MRENFGYSPHFFGFGQYLANRLNLGNFGKNFLRPLDKVVNAHTPIQCSWVTYFTPLYSKLIWPEKDETPMLPSGFKPTLPMVV